MGRTDLRPDITNYAEDSIIAWMHLPEPYKED